MNVTKDVERRGESKHLDCLRKPWIRISGALILGTSLLTGNVLAKGSEINSNIAQWHEVISDYQKSIQELRSDIEKRKKLLGMDKLNDTYREYLLHMQKLDLRMLTSSKNMLALAKNGLQHAKGIKSLAD